MGRYYSGDIEGKFWFGTQSSLAADRFGVTHEEPQFVNYYFEEENLEEVEKELKIIENNLGEKLQILKDFMNKKSQSGYTDKQLREIGISKQDFSEYADYTLGVKIRDCIKENGSCGFDAEL